MESNDIAIIDSSGQNRPIPDFMRSPEFINNALNMLSSLHKQSALENNNDSWPLLKFEIRSLQFLKLKNDGLFNKWWNDCYKEFKKLKHRIGSVDDDPEFWAKIIFDKCDDALVNSPNELIKISVKNGCCSSNSCPISIYMNILVESLNTKL